MALSADQLEKFAVDGYVGPVEILSREEMAAVADVIAHDVLVETDQSRAIYGFHSNRDVHLYSRAILGLASHPRLVSCLTQLLGRDVVLWRTTAFHKPPASDEASLLAAFNDIDWHQGMDFITPDVDLSGQIPSLGLSRAENMKDFPLNITAWIAVDEATEESGTLLFVAGSHRLGPLHYVKVETSGGFNRTGLKSAYEGVLDTTAAKVIEVPAGSCLLFNNLVFHKSLPNRSPRRRLGIACRFVGGQVPVYRNGDPAGFDISNWGCIPIAGQPDPATNRIIDRQELPLQ